LVTAQKVEPVNFREKERLRELGAGGEKKKQLGEKEVGA